jgi:hypothetical protein
MRHNFLEDGEICSGFLEVNSNCSEPLLIRSKEPVLLRAIEDEIRYTTVEPTKLNAHFVEEQLERRCQD